MNSDKKGINTICIHEGGVEDVVFKGATSPLYMSTSYAFEDVDVKRYPRYYNTPNQEALSKKLATLEHAEEAMIFGSGMAAISTALMTFLQAGDHVVFQQTLYGGTYNFAVKQLERFGIAYTFTEGWNVEDFQAEIKSNTKLIYIETPSNPLLTITDLSAIVGLAKKEGIMTMIDNTFASPINQNPIDFGIDVVLHSATKYMGGHSDICAGVIASTKANMEKVFETAICFGGSLSEYTVWLLERSLKTMGLRVKAQSTNALQMAEYLVTNPDVVNVHYPGLTSHPDHELAKSQMHAFGGMLTFELHHDIDVSLFFKQLKMIKPSMSLAGVESTVSSPVQTSHALMSADDREKQGINEFLVRFSLGIEDIDDLVADIEQAIAKIRSLQVHA
ncbi:PLP-dependent aspartate aminotransferase family protein [Muricauda sp. 2012CJ35-5]|uniref:PLP-dependent aspartate aminotransferase family protein n=1 Tax=Flagellimonas spongiicola TaxID=2942208 RepID=A0ABT0PQA7_9FLAO|nr:PLP-dependent aspartate aminotransferase family protein [Allomuricauda spongiicola]MCL6273580.1 PLP-dependent aspartate aminotransferase family protein [Allomuricauda spongiicola]